MNGTNLFDYCKDAANDGTSVWVFQGKKHLTYLASRLRSIPKFNTNYTYCVINCRHNVSILGDQPFKSLKVFFWVGARCPEYDSNFEQISQDIQEFIDEQSSRTKARIYVEFQYSESTQFFSLFKRFNYEPKDRSNQLNQYCCIQYQDYSQGTERSKPRAIPFPKYLIIERASTFFHSNQDVFIRIHEKPKLDHKNETLGLICLQGQHIDRQGTAVVDMNATHEIFEDVLSVCFTIGKDVDPELSNFIQILAQSYQVKFPKAEVLTAKWEDFKIEGKLDLVSRVSEPYRVKRYQLNHKIVNEEWEKKKREQLDTDDELTLYKVVNPAQNLFFEKQGEQSSFDPSSFAVYKVNLEDRADYVPMTTRKTRHTSYICSMKERFQMTFQELNIDTFDSSCLSDFFVYLLVTPVTVFMWLGKEIEEEARSGSMSIIKAFFQDKMPERLELQPSYISQKKFSETIKIRLEFAGYESQAFISHLGHTSVMPTTDDIQGFLMLRRPKKAYWVSQKEIDYEDNLKNGGKSESEQFDNLMNTHFDQNPRMTNLLNDKDTYDHERVKESFKKASVKNTESDVKTAMGNVKALRTGTGKDGGLDLEASTEKQNYMIAIQKSKFLDQQKIMSKIRAEFNPLQCLQQTVELSSKPAFSQEAKIANWNLKNFDAIWTFEIVGRKFEQHTNPLEMGVFSSAKCYFIVCVKGAKVAIYLWRGQNQTLINWDSAFEVFLDTKFRNVTNSQKDRQTTRFASQISNTGFMGGLSSSDALIKEDIKPINESHHLKSTFKPIDQSQQANLDSVTLDKERISNIDPVKISETVHEINLRSIVAMDNEPQHFLQVFQGAVAVTTDDYLHRHKKSYSDDPEQEECHVMLFQLIGMPCLNQRAREVPPFRSSLSSSGLYLMVSKMRLIFWIGHDFYDCYLDNETYNVQTQLINEDLLNKILYIFEQSNYAGIEEITEDLLAKTVKKKVYYSVEGTDVAFNEYIDGEKVDYDLIVGKKKKNDEVSSDSESSEELNEEYMIDFESKVVQQFNLPYEPKLFPLFVNGREISYGAEQTNDDDEPKSQEKRLMSELIQFVQIHNFHQGMLHPAGMYLLDFESLAFVWVGKKVPKSKIPQAFKLATDAMLAINVKGKQRLRNMSFSLVFYGFEPEVFKSAFRQGWARLDQPGLDGKGQGQAIVEEEEEDDSDDEKKKIVGKKLILTKEQSESAGRTLIAEAYWIN